MEEPQGLGGGLTGVCRFKGGLNGNETFRASPDRLGVPRADSAYKGNLMPKGGGSYHRAFLGPLSP